MKSVPLTWGRRVTRGGARVPRPDQAILPGRSGVRWTAAIDRTDIPAPGIYRVRIESEFRDGRGQPLPVNNREISVEIRDVVAREERVESLRITAMRAVSGGDRARAEAAIGSLQRAHPNSVFARTMRGELAMLRGDAREAKIELQQALDLLRSRGDALYVAHATDHSQQELIEGLETRLRRLATR